MNDAMGENAQITNNVEKNESESRQEASGGFEDVGRLMHFHRQFIKSLFFSHPRMPATSFSFTRVETTCLLSPYIRTKKKKIDDLTISCIHF